MKDNQLSPERAEEIYWAKHTDMPRDEYMRLVNESFERYIANYKLKERNEGLKE